jgi:polyhydroxyalkanoate synthase
MNSTNHHPFPTDKIMESMAEYAREMSNRGRRAWNVLSRDLDTAIAATPYDIVHQEDRVRLKHYKPPEGVKYNHPLLIVYALINRETMLDLQPDRSVVKNLLANGIDLYMLDWGYPTRKDRFQDLDDHINGYMDNAVKYILETHGLEQLNLMGVCMGGTMSAIYAAQHPEKIKNLMLTVAPTDFDTDTGLLHVWWGNRDFDVDRMVEIQGNISGDLLNFNFLLMNPARLMLDKYVGYAEKIDEKEFVENFVRMEKWIYDSPDVPGELFRQFIRWCYQENRLINNRLEIGGRPVDLKQITMPVLNMYARHDHLVPPAACERITGEIGSTDAEDFALNTGHIGIYVSSKSQKEFVPKICSWLKERDEMPAGKRGPKVAAVPSKKASGGRSPGRPARQKRTGAA